MRVGETRSDPGYMAKSEDPGYEVRLRGEVVKGDPAEASALALCRLGRGKVTKWLQRGMGTK